MSGERQASPRYLSEGDWYKGNTHIHSTVSDGGLTFAELEQAYSGAGYDFLFRTDHWASSSVLLGGGGADSPLLWLDGIELDGFDEHSGYYHVVCLGAFTGIQRQMGFPERARCYPRPGRFADPGTPLLDRELLCGGGQMGI